MGARNGYCVKPDAGWHSPVGPVFKTVTTYALAGRRKVSGLYECLHVLLSQVIQETFRLWRRHHLGYDQTKYVAERVRRRLALEPARTRNRTVDRLRPYESSPGSAGVAVEV